MRTLITPPVQRKRSPTRAKWSPPPTITLPLSETSFATLFVAARGKSPMRDHSTARGPTERLGAGRRVVSPRSTKPSAECHRPAERIRAAECSQAGRRVERRGQEAARWWPPCRSRRSTDRCSIRVRGAIRSRPSAGIAERQQPVASYQRNAVKSFVSRSCSRRRRRASSRSHGPPLLKSPPVRSPSGVKVIAPALRGHERGGRRERRRACVGCACACGASPVLEAVQRFERRLEDLGSEAPVDRIRVLVPEVVGGDEADELSGDALYSKSCMMVSRPTVVRKSRSRIAVSRARALLRGSCS